MKARDFGWRVQFWSTALKKWMWDYDCRYYDARAAAETYLRARRLRNPDDTFRLAYRGKPKRKA